MGYEVLITKTNARREQETLKTGAFLILLDAYATNSVTLTSEYVCALRCIVFV